MNVRRALDNMGANDVTLDQENDIKYAVYVVVIEDTNEALETLSPIVASLDLIDQDIPYADAMGHIDDIKRWAAE